MRLVFLGAPGVGKGTQAKKLEQAYGWTVIATGDLLRSAVAEGTSLGLEAKQYIERGELVPDALVNQIVSERLLGLTDFILDGYPRNRTQAEMLEQMLTVPLHAVIYFELGEAALVARLSGRRICPNCGAVYHVIANPSKAGEHCERCGSVLVTRDDDKPETIRHRLQVYHQQTAPLIEFYQSKGLLHRVDGDADPETVYQRLLRVLNVSI